MPQDGEQRPEDRHLHEQGQAARHGIDAVLFVELHHLLALPLLIVLVLLLELRELGLHQLHLAHRTCAALGQRIEQELGRDRDQDDHETVVGDEAMQKQQEPEHEFRNGTEHGRTQVDEGGERRVDLVQFVVVAGTQEHGIVEARPLLVLQR